MATIDIAFKQLLDATKNKEVVISFINTFVPQFAKDAVEDIESASLVIPPLPKGGDQKERATFMDVHVKSKSGASYIIEMQASHHRCFDNRAVYYLCNTHARQLNGAEVKDDGSPWYTQLKPTIAIQVLNYDTNRVRGVKSDVVDPLVQRVNANPLEPAQYMKHYLFKDIHSKQKLHDIQIIQIELPRYPKEKPLYPPNENFTVEEWWLSILKHSGEYTRDVIHKLANEGKIPSVVATAFDRLDYSKWNPGQVKEYKLQLQNRKEFEVVYAVEHAEGKLEGKLEAKLEAARELKLMKLTIEQIRFATGLTEEEIRMIE
jgi:predicted transposase/invertase (TIGR01784 family)